ncbi:MAG: MFS transporter [Patescibacteria group bacterium]
MRRELWILLFAGNVWYFGEGMLGPLFAVFASRIGGDILEIAWAWAVFLIVSGILTIVVGKISDKYDKRRLMIAGYALNAVATFGYLFVSDTATLFAVQILLGIANALATPTWDALVDKYSGRKQDGTVWGLADGLPQIVTGIAAVCGALVLTYSSFTVLFFAMGCVQVAAAILQYRILYKAR